MEGVYADKQLLISRDGVGGLSFAGAIDHFNADAMARAIAIELDRPDSEGGLRLDMSRLEFADVTGIKALVRVAEGADKDRPLVVTGLPWQIARVMTLVGWAELPNLVVEES